MKASKSNCVKVILPGILDVRTFSLILWFMLLFSLGIPLLPPALKLSGVALLTTTPCRCTGFPQGDPFCAGACSIRALRGWQNFTFLVKFERRDMLPEAPHFASRWSLDRYLDACHCQALHKTLSLHGRLVLCSWSYLLFC